MDITKYGISSFRFFSLFLFIGLHFWDYGNAFLLEARRAGAKVTKKNANGQEDESGIQFRYDSYVQKIMGYEKEACFMTQLFYSCFK